MSKDKHDSLLQQLMDFHDLCEEDIDCDIRNKVVHVAECTDSRGAQLLALFNQCDERGRVTLLRLAQSMPKGPL